MDISTLQSLELVKRLKRAPSEHKGSAGKVLLVGGAPGMAGALMLSGSAALHLGAGWTILEMLDPTSAHAIPEQAELMVRLASFDAPEQLLDTTPDLIAIGPGLGFSALARAWLSAILKYPKVPLVIDADAINLIADTPEFLDLLRIRNQAYPNMSVLTPHPGEAAHLLNSTPAAVQEDRISALHRLIELTHSIVVLRGSTPSLARPHMQRFNAKRATQEWLSAEWAMFSLAALQRLLLKASDIISIFGNQLVLEYNFMQLRPIVWSPNK